MLEDFKIQPRSCSSKMKQEKDLSIEQKPNYNYSFYSKKDNAFKSKSLSKFGGSPLNKCYSTEEYKLPEKRRDLSYLEENYIKNTKKFTDYLENNKKGLRLIGNSKYANATIDTFLEENEEYKKFLLQKIREKNFDYIDLNSKEYYEGIGLTPLPSKSRLLMTTNKEIDDFKKAERGTVQMRMVEYTHNFMTEEGKKKLEMTLKEKENERQEIIWFITRAAIFIQRWWRAKSLRLKTLQYLRLCRKQKREGRLRYQLNQINKGIINRGIPSTTKNKNNKQKLFAEKNEKSPENRKTNKYTNMGNTVPGNKKLLKYMNNNEIYDEFFKKAKNHEEDNPKYSLEVSNEISNKDSKEDLELEEKNKNNFDSEYKNNQKNNQQNKLPIKIYSYKSVNKNDKKEENETDSNNLLRNGMNIGNIIDNNTDSNRYLESNNESINHYNESRKYRLNEQEKNKIKNAFNKNKQKKLGMSQEKNNNNTNNINNQNNKSTISNKNSSLRNSKNKNNECQNKIPSNLKSNTIKNQRNTSCNCKANEPKKQKPNNSLNIKINQLNRNYQKLENKKESNRQPSKQNYNQNIQKEIENSKQPDNEDNTISERNKEQSIDSYDSYSSVIRKNKEIDAYNYAQKLKEQQEIENLTISYAHDPTENSVNKKGKKIRILNYSSHHSKTKSINQSNKNLQSNKCQSQVMNSLLANSQNKQRFSSNNITKGKNTTAGTRSYLNAEANMSDNSCNGKNQSMLRNKQISMAKTSYNDDSNNKSSSFNPYSRMNNRNANSREIIGNNDGGNIKDGIEDYNAYNAQQKNDDDYSSNKNDDQSNFLLISSPYRNKYLPQNGDSHEDERIYNLLGRHNDENNEYNINNGRNGNLNENKNTTGEVPSYVDNNEIINRIEPDISLNYCYDDDNANENNDINNYADEFNNYIKGKDPYLQKYLNKNKEYGNYANNLNKNNEQQNKSNNGNESENNDLLDPNYMTGQYDRMRAKKKGNNPNQDYENDDEEGENNLLDNQGQDNLDGRGLSKREREELEKRRHLRQNRENSEQEEENEGQQKGKNAVDKIEKEYRIEEAIKILENLKNKPCFQKTKNFEYFIYKLNSELNSQSKQKEEETRQKYEEKLRQQLFNQKQEFERLEQERKEEEENQRLEKQKQLRAQKLNELEVDEASSHSYIVNEEEINKNRPKLNKTKKVLRKKKPENEIENSISDSIISNLSKNKLNELQQNSQLNITIDGIPKQNIYNKTKLPRHYFTKHSKYYPDKNQEEQALNFIQQYFKTYLQNKKKRKNKALLKYLMLKDNNMSLFNNNLLYKYLFKWRNINSLYNNELEQQNQYENEKEKLSKLFLYLLSSKISKNAKKTGFDLLKEIYKENRRRDDYREVNCISLIKLREEKFTAEKMIQTSNDFLLNNLNMIRPIEHSFKSEHPRDEKAERERKSKLFALMLSSKISKNDKEYVFDLLKAKNEEKIKADKMKYKKVNLISFTKLKQEILKRDFVTQTPIFSPTHNLRVVHMIDQNFTLSKDKFNKLRSKQLNINGKNMNNNVRYKVSKFIRHIKRGTLNEPFSRLLIKYLLKSKINMNNQNLISLIKEGNQKLYIQRLAKILGLNLTKNDNFNDEEYENITFKNYVSKLLTSSGINERNTTSSQFDYNDDGRRLSSPINKNRTSTQRTHNRLSSQPMNQISEIDNENDDYENDYDNPSKSSKFDDPNRLRNRKNNRDPNNRRDNSSGKLYTSMSVPKDMRTALNLLYSKNRHSSGNKKTITLREDNFDNTLL